MKKKLAFALTAALGLSVAIGIGASAADTKFFTDDFSKPLSSAYVTYDGEWSVKDGVLSQTSMDRADPKKAIITAKDLPSDIQITAKVRIDSWSEHDMSRAGVSLFSNTDDGRGYNMLFHQDHERVQFLDDMVAWGESYEFAWEDNTWYWFKLKKEGDVLSGKVWKDGTPEPADWPFVQDSWTLDREGYPALNGGSSNGDDGALASFDDVTISTPDK